MWIRTRSFILGATWLVGEHRVAPLARPGGRESLAGQLGSGDRDVDRTLDGPGAARRSELLDRSHLGRPEWTLQWAGGRQSLHASRNPLRRAAADPFRSDLSRPLRPSRRGDRRTAGPDLQSALRGSAGPQDLVRGSWHHERRRAELGRVGDHRVASRSSVRRPSTAPVAPSPTRDVASGHPGPFSDPSASTSPETPATTGISRTSATPWARSTWRPCPSARTRRGRSRVRFTSRPKKRSRPRSTSVRSGSWQFTGVHSRWRVSRTTNRLGESRRKSIAATSIRRRCGSSNRAQTTAW